MIPYLPKTRGKSIFNYHQLEWSSPFPFYLNRLLFFKGKSLFIVFPIDSTKPYLFLIDSYTLKIWKERASFIRFSCFPNISQQQCKGNMCQWNFVFDKSVQEISEKSLLPLTNLEQSKRERIYITTMFEELAIWKVDWIRRWQNEIFAIWKLRIPSKVIFKGSSMTWDCQKASQTIKCRFG